MEERRISRAAKWSLVGLITLLLLAEVGARMAGLIDFPLYEANDDIGYVPKSSQNGSFMNSNDWSFNEYNMGAGPFKPGPDKTDVLLVGDSIVFGGNPYKQYERLGPQLEKLSGNLRVWPISAGSWTLQNELTWLEQHPEVVNKVRRIAFILNSGDFGEPSSWKCETTHPTSKPVSALLYLTQKHLWDWTRCAERDAPFPVVSRDWRPRLKALLAAGERRGTEITFYLYPNKDEHANKDAYLKWAAVVEADLLQVGAVDVQPLFMNESLPEDYYKDGIHPSASGIVHLSKALLSQHLAAN